MLSTSRDQTYNPRRQTAGYSYREAGVGGKHDCGLAGPGERDCSEDLLTRLMRTANNLCRKCKGDSQQRNMHIEGYGRPKTL